MTGDAPKDFLGVYEYGYVPKSKCKKWSKYIAKHGHKYYPMESITEFLIYKIGKTLGYNVANAKLALVGGQIRFLSKYFITNICTQVLEHGADLYAGYLNNARQFVDDVEFKKLSHNFFTVQFTESVFKHFYPINYSSLMSEFLDMLVFDAIVGNNDRHFYNWGILKNIKNHVAPIFAPIYDTARGLFWNEFE
ncbi:MAG: HipA domain-containing protein [Bacteroidales bacterium]|nr:HipA domain-containing protein [Bacteroidales bacterium]MDD4216423.1 HipA domain-containing protein [Bacteroidales bacterium]